MGSGGGKKVAKRKKAGAGKSASRLKKILQHLAHEMDEATQPNVEHNSRDNQYPSETKSQVNFNSEKTIHSNNSIFIQSIDKAIKLDVDRKLESNNWSLNNEQDINHNSVVTEDIGAILPSKKTTIENNLMNEYELNNNIGCNPTSFTSNFEEKLDGCYVGSRDCEPEVITDSILARNQNLKSKTNCQFELNSKQQLHVEEAAEPELDSNPQPQLELNTWSPFESTPVADLELKLEVKEESEQSSSVIPGRRRSKRDTLKKSAEPVIEVSRTLRKRLGGKVEKASRAIANTTVPKRAPKGFKNMLIKSCLGVKRVLVNTKIVLEDEPENKALKFEKSVLAPILEEDECLESF